MIMKDILPINKCNLFITISITCLISINCFSQTPVEQHGRLSVKGNRIIDQNNDTVQLKGMSLFWSQWISKYYNYTCIKWLRDDWNNTVIRAAMAVEGGGYLSNATAEETKVDTVIDAAIKLGMYVIIDWHQVSPTLYTTQAQNFFVKMAKKYGNYPNVIYEPFNEPTGITWTALKSYFNAVIDSIRQYDPDNIIICGTPNWSQYVDDAANDPIADTNIAYALHYYSGTHKQWLRDRATSALNRGCALFVTEYGTCDASGGGTLDYNESVTWWNFLDRNKISWCNWALDDKTETSAALMPGANANGEWDSAMISPSGWFVRAQLRGDTLIIPKPKPVEINFATGNDFILYPNPTYGILNIQISDKLCQNAELNVYDNMGRLIFQSKLRNNKFSINISGSTKGMYYLKITTDKNVFVKSVLKK